MASVMTMGEMPSTTMPSAVDEADQAADGQHQSATPRSSAASEPFTMPASRMPQSADRPWHRQVEPAGEDDRALAKRQDQQEGRKHQQRVVIGPVRQGTAESSAG